MVRLTKAVSVFALATLPVVTADAQPVVASSRVRLSTATRVDQGDYLGREGDILLLRTDRRDTARVALARVVAVGRSLGVHGHALKGMGLASLVGACVGGLIGALASTPSRSGAPFSGGGRLGPAAGVAAIGAVAFAPIGLVFGALDREERWQRVAQPTFDRP
jgi:hypothetical protein